MIVKKNDKVKIRYTGTLDNGVVFDSSEDGEPLEFIVGSGQIIPDFDKAVEGMKLDEEKKFTVKPEDAYGLRSEVLIREFPKTFFPENFKPENGMLITLQDKEGKPITAKIAGSSENGITVDLNHPLAGENLHFNIKVVEIGQ